MTTTPTSERPSPRPEPRRPVANVKRVDRQWIWEVTFVDADHQESVMLCATDATGRGLFHLVPNHDQSWGWACVDADLQWPDNRSLMEAAIRWRFSGVGQAGAAV